MSCASVYQEPHERKGLFPSVAGWEEGIDGAVLVVIRYQELALSEVFSCFGGGRAHFGCPLGSLRALPYFSSSQRTQYPFNEENTLNYTMKAPEI